MRTGDAVASAPGDLRRFVIPDSVDPQYKLVARCYPARARSALRSTVDPACGALVPGPGGRLHHVRVAAIRTEVIDWLVPGDEVAGRIALAAEEGAPLLRPPLDDLPFAAVGTPHADRVSSGRALRHSGKPLQARNLPYRPSLITIGRPHFSQSSPGGSSLSRTRSIVCSALGQRLGERPVELAQRRAPRRARRRRSRPAPLPSGR